MHKVARRFVTVMAAPVVAGGLVLAFCAPASADTGTYKTVNCTGSNGYSALISANAKGEVVHSLDNGSTYFWYKGVMTSLTYKFTNTGAAGSHDAWVNALDYGSTTGALNTMKAGCGTSGSTSV